MRTALLLATVMLIAACSTQSAQNQNTLRVNIYCDCESLDPRLANDVTSRNVLNMLYEGLTRIAADGEFELALAHSVDVSLDGLHYTFALRETFWSNGDPVTADDFVRTWRTMLSPNFPAPLSYQLFVLKNGRAAKRGEVPVEVIGVRAIDERTLGVELEYQAPYFLSMLSNCFFCPAHPQPGVVNGPFQIKKHIPNRQLTVEKNQRYWDAATVHLDRIEMAIISNENTELAMCECNELDWAGAPFTVMPFDAIASLRANQQLHLAHSGETYWYKLNTKHPLLKNRSIRQALSYVLDRENIVRCVSRGLHIKANGVIPPNLCSAPHPDLLPYDVDRGKKLFAQGLQELGIQPENLPPIELSFNYTDDHLKFAQAIQQQWKEHLGLQVVLKEQEWGIHLQKLASRDYQIGRHAWHAYFPDPIDFLNVFRHTDDYPGGWINNTHWSSADYTALLEEADHTTDPHLRNQILLQAHKLLLDEMPVIPLLHLRFGYLHAPNLTGAVFSNTGIIDFTHARFISYTSDGEDTP